MESRGFGDFSKLLLENKLVRDVEMGALVSFSLLEWVYAAAGYPHWMYCDCDLSLIGCSATLDVSVRSIVI